jgi:hypothetical protein
MNEKKKMLTKLMILITIFLVGGIIFNYDIGCTICWNVRIGAILISLSVFFMGMFLEQLHDKRENR